MLKAQLRSGLLTDCDATRGPRYRSGTAEANWQQVSSRRPRHRLRTPYILLLSDQLPHFTTNELATRYRSASDPIERSRWHFLWLLRRGFTATTIAEITGYSAYWIGQIARRYNVHGADGVRDRRHHTRTGAPLLSEEHCEELRAALLEPAPGSDRWCGRTMAAWISQRLGRRVPRQVGWRWLRRIGAQWRKPRPRHIAADLEAQRDFKQSLRPLLRRGVARSLDEQLGLSPVMSCHHSKAPDVC